MNVLCDNCCKRKPTTHDGTRELCNKCFFKIHLLTHTASVFATSATHATELKSAWLGGQADGYLRGVAYTSKALGVIAVIGIVVGYFLWRS